MMKAIWGLEYDMHTDKCYNTPSCPECDIPLFSDDGICVCCGNQLELDDSMKEWLAERTGSKTEVGECIMCGENKMKIKYIKNNVTNEWQAAMGECECGCKFIV